MYPDSVFATPVGSFRAPVPVIDEDPDAGTVVQICVNQNYLPYIIGCLKQLLLQSTWRTDDPDVLALQQNRIFNLIDLFQPDVCSPSHVTYNVSTDVGTYLQHTINGVFSSGLEYHQIVGIGQNFTVRLRDLNDNLCGAVCSELVIADPGGSALNLISLVAYDCDAPYFSLSKASRIDRTDLPSGSFSEIVIASTEPVYYEVVFHGPITCGVT